MSDQDDLLAAVQKDDATRTAAILDGNPLIARMRTPNGTLILTAVYHGAGNALRVLLERTAEDALGLHEAAAVGNARRLKTILGQSRVRVNTANAEGFTPLGLAAFFGHLEAVKVLLENGAEVNLKLPSRFANTALDAAVAGDHASVVKALLTARGDPNTRSEANYTSLHKAAAHGNLEIVRMLLDAGADPSATRDGGHTPLDDARENSHPATVNLILERGA